MIRFLGMVKAAVTGEEHEFDHGEIRAPTPG
jgi:hypothetical protein